MNLFKENKYEIYRQFLLMLGIAFLCVASERITSGRRYDEEFPLRWFLIRIPLLSIIAFTIVAHYYWLYDKYAVHKRYGKYFSLLICYLIFVIILDFGGNALLFVFDVWDAPLEPVKLLRVSMERVFIAVMPFAYVYAVVRQYQKARKTQRILEQENHKNEMLLLRGKLEPAFIYGTINALYTAAQNEQAMHTAAYMGELKELFRYSAEEAEKEKVQIGIELDFIKRYLQLQKMRIVDDTNITIDAKAVWDNEPADIAPMLLLPFIENAFKYGISYEQPSKINVVIVVAKQRLVFTCDNIDHDHKLHAHSTGMGLANAVKRLELQYKGKYQLDRQTTNGNYAVSLKIDLS